MLLALETSQIAAAVAVLVLAALIVALLARALVSRRARPAKELPQAEKRETIEPPRIGVPEVAAPSERLAREQHAREELRESEELLHAAREAVAREPDSSAARAELQRGLDALISGEPSEPAMADAREAGMTFIAGGHYATETFGIRALGERIAEEFGVEHRFVEVPNPV